MQIKSIITSSIQEIYQATTVTDAKQKLIALLEQSKIKEVDKLKMIETAKSLNSLNAIHLLVLIFVPLARLRHN